MNNDERNEYMRKYRSKNKERIENYNKEWRLNNQEKVKESQIKYVNNNQEKVANSKHRYANTEIGFLTTAVSGLFSPSKLKLRGYVPTSTKEELKNYFFEYVNKYGRICYYCLEPWTYERNLYKGGNGRSFKKFIVNNKNFSIDRLDNDKTYNIDNIVFCCNGCNASKNKISIKLIKRLNEIIKEKGL